MGLSKTDAMCECGFLKQAAADADLPIRFDERMNEFHILYTVNGHEGHVLIRHCFLCGGKAPESKRPSHFAPLSRQEQERLAKLTQPLKKTADVISTLGKPDHDNGSGMSEIVPEKDGKPQRVQVYRTLLYTKLSETADVHVRVHADDRVEFWFTGKYVGDSKESS